jgi:putative Mn2+ efflux pump MntP
MIADFIAELVTVIGTIMIIFGGIQYITSAGSEDKARRAKNTVLYAVIGIAIAVSVDFIIGFLGEVLGRGGN